MSFARPYYRKSIRPQASNTPAYYPDQVCKAYGFPQGVNPTGMIVGIIELGGQFYPADLQVACGARNLPIPPVTVVPVGGATISPDPGGADVEVMLDVENAAAAFPGCAQRVYFADNTEEGFLAAVQQAVRECDTVSISWGAPEDQWSQSGMQSMNAAMAAKPTLVASGDSGSTDGEKGKHVDFPASSPNAIACGGTTLPSLTDLTQESAWSDSGGGVSTVFARPAYQSALSIKGATRCSPDLAACADPNTPYNVYVNGAWMQVGGTSAVAPLMAGLFAAIEAQTKSLTDVHGMIYASGNCRDVTSGSNGAYSAGPGYDLVTGMGVPIPAKLGGVVAPPPVSPPSPVSPPPPPPPVQLPVPLPTLEQLIQELLADIMADLEARVAGNAWLELNAFVLDRPIRDAVRNRVTAAVQTAYKAARAGKSGSAAAEGHYATLAAHGVKAEHVAKLRALNLPPGTLGTILQDVIQYGPQIVQLILSVIQAIQGGSASSAA